MRFLIENHPAKDAGNQSDYISSYRKRIYATVATSSVVIGLLASPIAEALPRMHAR